MGDFNCSWCSKGDGIVVAFPLSNTSRDRSKKNPQWSEDVILLNSIKPHLKTVVRIAKEHKMKSILSDPRRNDLESQASPCLWSRGSNNLYSLHILEMPLDELKKGSLPPKPSPRHSVNHWTTSFAHRNRQLHLLLPIIIK